MKLNLRLETPADYRAVEELTREAFWINTDCRDYIDEPFLVHKLRKAAAFVPELDYVAEVNGKLAGNIMYTKSKLTTDKGIEHEVLTFGPLAVLPEFQNEGVGKALVQVTIAEAKRLGFPAIVIFGHPDYYSRLGFRPAAELGLTTANGSTFPAFMALELFDGALDGIQGRFQEDAVFNDLPIEEIQAFDASFPAKTPRAKVTMETLLERLEPAAREAIRTLKLVYLGEMAGISEKQVAKLPGINAQALKIIKATMKEHGRIWGQT